MATVDTTSFFKNFFAGGNTRLRLQYQLVGAAGCEQQSLGGNRRLVGSVEVLFPMPGMRNDRSVRD